MKACVLRDVSIEQLPLLADFCPLYTAVSRGELEACATVVSGGVTTVDLRHRDATWIRAVGEAALETEAVCDVFIQLDAAAQLSFPIEGLSDFTMATLSDILAQLLGGEHLDAQEAMMNDLLLRVLDSETASPMLDYEWIFEDMVQYHVVDRRGIDPVWTLKRSAAHHLKLGDGSRMPQILGHMASVHLELDELSEAMRIYCELLRYDPLRLETLRSLASDLAHVQCYRAAALVGRHLLQVWKKEAAGQPLCPEMAAETALWSDLARKEPIESLSAHVLALLYDGLFSSETGHLDAAQSARAAIPEIDTVPVKKPLW